MKRPHKAKPRRQQDLARERIAILLGQAAARFSEEPELSNRYVRLARRIAMRAKVHLLPAEKRRICAGCQRFLVPGANCRTRLSGAKVTLTCLACGKVSRFPYLREQRTRRTASGAPPQGTRSATPQ